ncbi:hypothetical protein ACFLVX_01555 [Chloroflexota bacterium]
MKKKKVEHLKKKEEIALDCFHRRNRGQSEEGIGIHYNWKRQIDEHGNVRCVTARRYVSYGKMVHERIGMLREEVFGIKYKAPIRVRRRKKPIDKLGL